MKKNIKDYIGTKTVIWIDAHTLEQENAIKDLLLADGRITRWRSGNGLKQVSYLSSYTKTQGYYLDISDEIIIHNSKKFYKSIGYQVIPASEFLQPEFEYLEEIEVSDYKDFSSKSKRQYIATLPSGKVVTINKDTELIASWKYARKINRERTEAISTIKSLMQKHNISKDEI